MQFWKWNRRNFLKRVGIVSMGSGILAAGGERSAHAASRGTWGAASTDVYARLGLRPVINAKGTYTSLSGSRMPPEVADAMQEASRSYVSIPELLEKSGEHLARLLPCEAALVTSGAAGALMVGTAACVAGNDEEKARRLPDTLGMKNEVIIQKSHRFSYDHAVRNVGVRLVEIESRKDLEAAVNPRTALMLFLNKNDPEGKIHHEEWIEVGKKHHVPTFNDCAADVPPVENLTQYTRMGYDLVTFSGGKALRGPQCSGLLLGRKSLIESARIHNYPESDTICRPCKVGKEEIIGLVTAVERYLKLDHAAEWRGWERQIETIDLEIKKVDGVRTERHVPEIANHVPHLMVRWPEEWNFSREACRDALREGEPRIEVGTTDDDDGDVLLNTFMLNPGEERIVARKLRQALARANSNRSA